MSIGKIAEFNVHKDDWKLYVERLEQYFVVNKIPDDLHVPTLITVMGAESYELLVNLCTPNKPKLKTFEQLSEIICKHLQPKPSELAERYKFRHRKQKEGETISDYVAVLKKMSKTCEFGSWLEESLRDQLVCGIASENIRQRLFAELQLDFAKAYKLAASMESAEKDAAVVERPKSLVEKGSVTVSCQAMAVRRQTTGVAVRSGQPSVAQRDVRVRRDVRERPAGRESTLPVPGERAWPEERARPQRWCRVCGANHDESSCKFAHYVCRVCNRPGLLRRVCPNLVAQHQVDVQTAGSDEEADSDEEQVNNLPDVMARCLQQCWERAEQRRNFLHPDTAAAAPTPPSSTITPYTRTLATASHPWPPSPVLQPAGRTHSAPESTTTHSPSPAQPQPSSPAPHASRPPLPS